ncbi:unnamed protein product [Nippostrongylus brasiliensis]|uniref:Transposase n=1 Tax=Nippostrongylus brasiliensis TaxID=27835 RepID=A0A0N4XPM4_NIPBR|nr:unnamed protein product [Nippostrongylus brasiliensis]
MPPRQRTGRHELFAPSPIADKVSLLQRWCFEFDEHTNVIVEWLPVHDDNHPEGVPVKLKASLVTLTYEEHTTSTYTQEATTSNNREARAEGVKCISWV